MSNLRRDLVKTALAWQKKYGVAPAITSAISELDAALLVGMSEEEYSDYMQNQTAVQRGLDFRFNGVKAQGRFRTDNGEAVRDACVQGLGITINSSWSAYQQLQSGQLVQILKNFPLISDTAIWAIYPSSRQLAPKVRAFIDYFSHAFEQSNSRIPYWEISGNP